MTLDARRRAILAVRVIIVAGVLLLVSRHYDSATGFTPLINFAEFERVWESERLQQTPHFRYPGRASYDGQFYAQLALDPLLRQPDTDTLMDLAPYRARRILFSMTAWCLGLGQPFWILQAYALQNVLAWLILAWWLARRLPPDDWRAVAVWAGCLLTQGLMASVRLAVLDGPSLLLIVLAVAAVDRGKLLAASAILGIAALGRETNLLAAIAFIPLLWESRPRLWRLAIAGLLLISPWLLWVDYLRPIYRSTVLAHGDSFGPPLLTFLDQWLRVYRHPFFGSDPQAAWRNPATLVLVSLTAQAIYLGVRPGLRKPIWWVGAAFTIIMLMASPIVWNGHPGATARVVLPMSFAFNVLLLRERTFWPWWVAGNLTMAAGVLALLS